MVYFVKTRNEIIFKQTKKNLKGDYYEKTTVFK